MIEISSSYLLSVALVARWADKEEESEQEEVLQTRVLL